MGETSTLQTEIDIGMLRPPAAEMQQAKDALPSNQTNLIAYIHED